MPYVMNASAAVAADPTVCKLKSVSELAGPDAVLAPNQKRGEATPGCTRTQ